MELLKVNAIPFNELSENELFDVNGGGLIGGIAVALTGLGTVVAVAAAVVAAPVTAAVALVAFGTCIAGQIMIGGGIAMTMMR
jgi:hypothetical protein